MAAGNVAFVPMNQGFDERDPKYKCCCSKCHVKTGVKIIAILMIIGSSINIISAFYGMVSPADPETKVHYLGGHNITFSERTTFNGVDVNSLILTRNITGFLYFLIELVVAILMLVALAKSKKELLIPFLVYTGVGIVCIVVFGIVIIILAVIWGAAIMALLGDSQAASDEDSGFLVGGVMVFAVIVILVLIIILVGIEIWFFLVALNCWRYYKAKELYGNGQGAAYSQPAQPNTYYPSDAYQKPPAYNPHPQKF